MEILVKTLSEMTGREALRLLSARERVFVEEQNWVHREVDERDFSALHLWIEDRGEIAACARVFSAGEGAASLGRVLTIRRGEGFGKAAVLAAEQAAKTRLGARKMELHAQVPVRAFYEALGYRAASGTFEEWGVPHVRMEKEL